MSFLDMLSGAGQIGEAKGFDINRADFEIKDADKLFGQTQDQYTAAVERAKPLEQKRTTLLDTLEQSALGTGPSLAKEQLKQAQDRNLAQQLAMVQGQRGGSASANTRNLMRAQSEGAAQVANQGVTAGIQEQQANRQLYSQALGQEQQAVDALTQQYLSMGFDIRAAQQQALEDYNVLQVQQATQLAGINAENQRARGQMTGQLVGGLISGAASMGAAGITAGAVPKTTGLTGGLTGSQGLQMPNSYLMGTGTGASGLLSGGSASFGGGSLARSLAGMQQAQPMNPYAGPGHGRLVE
jgi:hypothetical protein